MGSNKFIQIIADQQVELQLFDLRKTCKRPEEAWVDLGSHLAQIVIGVRRCGKSTLCHAVLKRSRVNYAYVNFDDERFANLTADGLNDVLEALYMVYGNFSHLFVDEIQNVKGWNLFVNRLLRQGMRLIITGSNAKLLSSELSTYLTGRYNQIELYPFSFSEYLELIGISANALSTKDIAFRKRSFDDYVFDGGFPELLRIKDKKLYIRQLVRGIIEVDIQKRFNVRYHDALAKIADYMIANFAQETNYKAIAELFGIGSQHTVRNYINYLRQTYLLVGLKKFSYKARERMRSEKMYLIDPAIFTAQEDNPTGDNIGWRLENVVYLELLRRQRADDVDLYYHRSNYEIDFVRCKNLKVVELIQVSAFVDNDKTFKRECRALIKGASDLKCSELTLITMRATQAHDFENLRINEVNIIDWLRR